MYDSPHPTPPHPAMSSPPNNLHDQSIHTRGRLSAPLSPQPPLHPQVIYCSLAPTQPLMCSLPSPPWLPISTPTPQNHTTLSLHTADTPLTVEFPQSLLNLTLTPKSFSDLHTLAKDFSVLRQCHPSTALRNGFTPSPTPNTRNFSQRNVRCPLELLYHKDELCTAYTFKKT